MQPWREEVQATRPPDDAAERRVISNFGEEMHRLREEIRGLHGKHASVKCHNDVLVRENEYLHVVLL